MNALSRLGIAALLAALALAAPAGAADNPTPAPTPAGPAVVSLPLEGQIAPPAMPEVILTPEPTPALAPSAEPAPASSPEPSADSGFPASAPVVGIAVLAALGLGFAAGSRRRPAASRPSPAHAPPAASAPRRTAAPRPAERRRPLALASDPALPSSGRAIVHSELAPDGYVELDGCLRRARWAAAGEPPAVGAPVRVEQRGNRLVAHAGRSR